MNEPNIPLYRMQTHTPYFPKIKKTRSKKKPINLTTINKYHNHNTNQMASAYRPRHKKLKTLDYKSHYQTKPTKNLKSHTFNTLIKPTQETQANLKDQQLHKLHPNPNLHPNPTPFPHTKSNLCSRYKPYQNQKKTLTYRPHQKPNLKNYITTKWKPHIITIHILQELFHTCLLTRHNTHQNHQNHKPHPKNHPYSKLNFHTKHKFYPKNKVTSAYRLHHPTNNKCHIQNKHPIFKYHPEFNYQLKYNSHAKYKHYPKHLTTSAYRPPHTNNNTYYIINNWKLN